MSFQPTPKDVSVIISTPTSGAAADSASSFATERRITPTWTISQLKVKLETMTGIPPGSQRLRLKAPGKPDQWVEGEERTIGEWGLGRGCEIEVSVSFLNLKDIVVKKFFPVDLILDIASLRYPLLPGYAFVKLTYVGGQLANISINLARYVHDFLIQWPPLFYYCFYPAILRDALLFSKLDQFDLHGNSSKDRH